MVRFNTQYVSSHSLITLVGINCVDTEYKNYQSVNCIYINNNSLHYNSDEALPIPYLDRNHKKHTGG